MTYLSRNARLALVASMLAVAVLSGGFTVQLVAAQETSQDPVASATQLILSVGTLVGALATIVSLVGSKLLVNHADNKLLQKVVYHADGLKGTDQALAEAKDDIATILEVATAVSPDFKAELEKRQKDIDLARQKADEYTDDVNRLYRVAAEKY